MSSFQSWAARAGQARSRLWPRRIRTRLAVLYAVLFLLAGSGLLALTYGLLASRLPAPTVTSKAVALRYASLLGTCKQRQLSGTASAALVAKCKAVFTAGAQAAARDQRDRTLATLLDVSLLGLAVATLASAATGWLLSGRVLRPVRSMTETARRASAFELGERLALDGPHDELKELADTFDEMLERLDAAFASQRRFVANAAHELRTPLTAMRTAIEVTITKPARTPEQLEAMAARVQRSVERAELTLDALLTLAASEHRPAGTAAVDLATAAEDALDAVARAVAERGIEVDAQLEPAPVRGDRVLLDRMVANLVDNAVRHNVAGGWIAVRTGEEDGTAKLAIENTGPTVPEQLIPTLFEPFGRVHERLDPDRGVGLGLSIASAIAHAHGAAITARPRPDGGLEITVLIASDGTMAPDARDDSD